MRGRRTMSSSRDTRSYTANLVRSLAGILIALLCVQSVATPAKAGIPVLPYLFGNPVQLAGGKIFHSSPTLVDLDPENGNGLEIIIGSVETCADEGSWPAVLSVLRSDGRVWWQRTVQGSINSAPAVEDIDNDGRLEIVVSTGGENYPETVGGVVAYERNGALKWSMTTLDRNGPEGAPNGRPDGVFASPSIADINDDGVQEVIFGAWDYRMYVVKGTNGSTVSPWPIEILDSSWSSPAIADLDQDGYLDITFGGDLSYNSAACTQDGGLFRAMSHDGEYLPGFADPVGCDPNAPLTYGLCVNQTIYSSPAIGDLDRDGDLEMVVGSGRAFPGGHWVKIWDSEGQLLRTLSTDDFVFSSPALADLNGDTYLDIVAGTDGGTVYAWDYHNNRKLWSVRPRMVSGQQGIPIASSPTVADIDSQHAGPEILFGFGPEVAVLSASGEQLTATATNDGRPTLWVGLSPVNGSPAVADIDGDGSLEIVVGGSYAPPGATQFDYRGYLFAWRWPGNEGHAAEADLPWPMFRHDPWHSGVAPQDGLAVSPTSVHLLYQYGSEDPDPSSDFQLMKVGTGALDWTACYSSTVDGPESGTVQYGSPSTIPFTVQASNYVTGTYDLGITIWPPAQEGDGTHTVDIRLSVGQIRKVFIPLGSKNHLP